MKRMVNQLYACLVVIGLWQLLYLMIGEPMVPSLLLTTERFIFLLQDDLIHHILYSFYWIFMVLFGVGDASKIILMVTILYKSS